MTIRLGYLIPDFSNGTGVEQLFPTVIAQAREAEDAAYAPGAVAAVAEALRPVLPA